MQLPLHFQEKGTLQVDKNGEHRYGRAEKQDLSGTVDTNLNAITPPPPAVNYELSIRHAWAPSATSDIRPPRNQSKLAATRTLHTTVSSRSVGSDPGASGRTEVEIVCARTPTRAFATRRVG